MTISITYDEERTIEEGNLYQVKQSVTASVGIDTNVYVFNTDDETFSRVAVVYDMEKIASTSKAEAETAGEPCYRSDTVTKAWESIDTAIEFSNYNRTRLQWLVDEYDTFVTSFVLEDPVTITLTSG